MTYRNAYRYSVTIHYLTPGGKPGAYTETSLCQTSAEAVKVAELCLACDPRRKVGKITGRTVEILP